ncbi:hypothetical protein [Rhodopseudomonas palustris]|uniref:hypothetical protein n=1 Tax=Rhodopseudomonas palustris TaxID=1076 RepID=UPI000D1B762C|nr:hypothetical protein [Rhodopseudomonas palustris]
MAFFIVWAIITFLLYHPLEIAMLAFFAGRDLHYLATQATKSERDEFFRSNKFKVTAIATIAASLVAYSIAFLLFS